VISVPSLLRNPVATRDLRLRLRNPRSIALLVVCGIPLAAIDAIFVLAHGSPAASEIPSDGSQLVARLAVCQLGIIVLLAGLTGAGLVTREKRQSAWELLLTSRLTASGILRGKLMAALAFDLLVLVVSLPFYATVAMYSDPTQTETVDIALVILASALLMSAIGLASGVLLRPGRETVSVMLMAAVVVGVVASAALAAALPPGSQPLLAPHFVNWPLYVGTAAVLSLVLLAGIGRIMRDRGGM
jgi:ABC-type transport system involved in multi-copper enzyme maturation permease subunit